MSRGIVVLLAFLAVGAPRALAQDDPAALVRDLGSADNDTRYAAYRALLAKHPPEALPLLAKAAPGFDLTAQSYGLSVVQSYPAEQSRPVLERWAAGDAPYLKCSAGAVLLRQGDSKAASSVAEALATPGVAPGALTMMLGQLYGLRDPKVVQAVRAQVRPDADPSVLGTALAVLDTIRDAGTRALVTPLLGAPSQGLRGMAAAYLFRLGDEGRADDVAAALRSREASYAEFVRISDILSRAPRLPDVVLDAVLALLENPPEGYSSFSLVGLLGRFSYVKAVPALRKAVESEDAATSRAAFEALSRIPGGLTPEVTRSLLEGGDETRRVAAADALRRADDLSGLPAVVDVLRRGTTSRAEAARVLAGFRVRAAVEPLIDALLDPDLGVRSNAQSSLSTVLLTLYPYRRLDLASTGYAPGASDAARQEAVRKIRAWWQANKDRDW